MLSYCLSLINLLINLERSGKIKSHKGNIRDSSKKSLWVLRNCSHQHHEYCQRNYCNLSELLKTEQTQTHKQLKKFSCSHPHYPDADGERTSPWWSPENVWSTWTSNLPVWVTILKGALVHFGFPLEHCIKRLCLFLYSKFKQSHPERMESIFHSS